MENNLEFYKYLEDSLKNSNELVDDSKMCLITQTPLVENFVRLECGHSFNYKPLYMELCSQKFRSNHYQNNSKSIIKCPYCRNQISTILPYYPELNLDLIYGINIDDVKYKKVNYHGECVYANTVEYHTGVCNYSYPKPAPYFSDFNCSCNYVVLHKETNKTYCGGHIQFAKREYIKQQNKEKRDKIKLEKKNKLLQEKEEKKLLQKQEKDKKKLENKMNKIKQKQENNEENIIIGLNSVIQIELDHNFCVRILKYGKNIGKQCGCKIFKDNLCKKHTLNEKKEDNI